MILVHKRLEVIPAGLIHVPVSVERRNLARRRWRTVASDGLEFGFELESPLAHGDGIHCSETSCYVLDQSPESVLELELSGGREEAALAGWSVGNLHFPVELAEGLLIVPDDPGLRLVLTRMGFSYRPSIRLFRPRRVAAGFFAHRHDTAPAA